MRANKRPTPLVDSQVRRSERVRQGNNGFKSSECSNIKCTSCNPPTLSTKVIRILGTQFCSTSLDDLIEGNLLKGGGKKDPITKKKTKRNKDTDASDASNEENDSGHKIT